MESLSTVDELVIFRVAHLVCGIEIRYVQEINRNVEITPVFRAVEYIKGVINLRGQIVTIIDLALRFALRDAQAKVDTQDQQIIVLTQEGEQVGLIVDEVDDVIELDNQDVERLPANISGISKTFFKNVYKRKEQLIPILNIAEIFNR